MGLCLNQIDMQIYHKIPLVIIICKSIVYTYINQELQFNYLHAFTHNR